MWRWRLATARRRSCFVQELSVRQWIVVGAVAIAAGTSAACSSKETPVDPAKPGAATRVSVLAVKSAMVVGTSQQLTTAIVDKNGKSVTTAAVTWAATPASVATVTSAGVLTAVAPGTVKVSASVGRIVGTADVQVDEDPCSKAVSMRVGDVRTFAGGSTVSCITIAASTGASEYVFIGANTRPVQDDLLQYSVSLGASASASSNSLLHPSINSAAALDALDPRLVLERQSMEQVDALHERLRGLERTAVNPVLRSGSVRRAALSNVSGAALAVSAAARAVGDTITVRVPNLNSGKDICKDNLPVRAVVRAVSTRATIVEDLATPTGGFTTADYQAIALEFDNLIFPTDTSWFGAPTDINGDGRITILYTPEVNKLSPPNAAGFTAGFFFGSDLIKKTEYPATNECRNQTNEQEVFYVLTPDPTGLFNNVRSTVTVRQGTRGVIAHEFQHMINQGVRQYNPAVAALETFWLNEALSHGAEEFVGRAVRGVGDFQRLSFLDVNPSVSAANDYNAFFRQNLVRFQRWMLRPDTSAPVSVQNRAQLAPRGASWALLRYSIDHYSNGAARAFTRALAAGPQTDVANLLARSKTAQFDQIISGWLVANYADGLSINGIASRYGYMSWNMRSVMEGVSSGVFPLVVGPFPGTYSTQALSSSGNYFRLARTSSSPQVQLKVQAPDGTNLTSEYPTVVIVRTK